MTTAMVKAEDDSLSSSCDLAAKEEIGHDTMSCPDKDGLAKFNLEVLRNTVSLDQAEAMSEAELHDGIGLTIARGAASYRSFCNLMTVVKRRLNEGKVVGGCRTLKAYVERWVMLPDQSFDAAIRKVYRAIADDAKDGRRTGRRKPKSGEKAETLEHRAETTPEPLPESTPTHVSPPKTNSEIAGAAPLPKPALAAQVDGAIAPFSPPALPEPEPDTLEELRQRISRMADTEEMSKALEKFVTDLLTPVLANHPYSPSHRVSVAISRRGKHRVEVGDWVEFVGGCSERLRKLIGDGKLGLGRVVGADELHRRPRVRWHDGREWKKPYSLFENDGRVHVLYDWQAAERYPEAFNSYSHENEAEAELKVATHEREATEAIVPQACEDYTEEEVARMFVPEELGRN